ncbi:GNAT family N-acetyltransferase [Lysinibacillus sp. NPDC097195]|uniref:GNAT family N-acetyltransferase n=1 Tax=Lysinibacillus sp. NPDC097195 TaxID=3364141 RepID=UPI00381A63B8
MLIDKKELNINGLQYTIRSAIKTDAKNLVALRYQIDGETENLDRVQGEAFIDTAGFEKIIEADTENQSSIFLVAVAQNQLVGFARCEGFQLKRFSHKTEFGVAILKAFWGYGIGKHFLIESISWAEENNIQKIVLNVLETNKKAIKLYQKHGFEIEGLLKKDKMLSDGKYYNTIVMGRFTNNQNQVNNGNAL